MQTTQRPPQAVEKSPFGPSILARLVTWKFLHHLPVYRQQELLLGPLKGSEPPLSSSSTPTRNTVPPTSTPASGSSRIG